VNTIETILESWSEKIKDRWDELFEEICRTLYFMVTINEEIEYIPQAEVIPKKKRTHKEFTWSDIESFQIMST
jgi:hypothetical protein